MKKFVQLVVVSILGGVITLGSYKLFIEKDSLPQTTSAVETSINPTDNAPQFISDNSNSNASFDSDLEESFKRAAKKTVHAVVHVKNLAISREPRNLSEYLRGKRGGKAVQGSGSGVIITPDGYITTSFKTLIN